MGKRLTSRTGGAVAALLLLTTLAGCGSEDDPGSAADDPSSEPTSDTSDSETSTEPGDETSSSAGGTTCTYTPDGQEPARPVDPPPAAAVYADKVTVTITTTAGPMSATLNGDTTPCTVNSFLSLAQQGFYDDTPCPRISTQPGFELLQCGDPSGTSSGGPGYTVQDELTGQETYPAGALAMANTGQPDTNGSQFFIVYGDTQLPPQYTVFGTVEAADLAVIEGVAAAGDDGSNPAGGGAPNEPIGITSIVPVR